MGRRETVVGNDCATLNVVSLKFFSTIFLLSLDEEDRLSSLLEESGIVNVNVEKLSISCSDGGRTPSPFVVVGAALDL